MYEEHRKLVRCDSVIKFCTVFSNKGNGMYQEFLIEDFALGRIEYCKGLFYHSNNVVVLVTCITSDGNELTFPVTIVSLFRKSETVSQLGGWKGTLTSLRYVING
jgi:hypothetical protein